MSEGSSRITVAIPTFSRSQYLERSLSEHRYLSDDHLTPVVISDNASNDGTRAVVERFSSECPLIRYHRNDTTIPPDENFEKALGYVATDYAWLLGDTYQIPRETFAAVEDAIAEDEYDVIVLNVSERVRDVPGQVYTDRSRLLADLGWHMTCMSALVYNRKLIGQANFRRYRDTNFLQTGIIFEYLAEKPLKVKWIPGHSVYSLKISGMTKSSWMEQTFEIWTKRWANFVFSLPATYSLDSKLKCAMDHGIKSGVFTFSELKRLRKRNILNAEIYRLYQSYFPLTIPFPLALIRLVALLPSWLFRIF
jgi:abequosyltransferase